jgi:Arc/MetJ-type ribon-helix-helix transcriptional regulator
MTTEMINLKLDSEFLNDIDEIVEKENYQNRTEFIRSALRDKVDKVKFKKTFEEIKKAMMGKDKRKTTEEEYEEVRKNILNYL